MSAAEQRSLEKSRVRALCSSPPCFLQNPQKPDRRGGEAATSAPSCRGSSREVGSRSVPTQAGQQPRQAALQQDRQGPFQPHTLHRVPLALSLLWIPEPKLFTQKSHYTTKGTTPPRPQHTPWAFPVRQRDPLALQSIPTSSDQ